MKKFIPFFGILLVFNLSGCKKKKNDIIEQAYGQPLKTYKRAKKKIKSIEKEHLKKLKSIEDSLE